MAAPHGHLPNIILLIALLLTQLILLPTSSLCNAAGNYSSIFSFGDSLADTGNLIVSNPAAFRYIGKLPYGMTYFGRPTGRCSDGRLIVDFLSEEFGLPMLPPYLSKGNDFRQGANFAVGGATALDPEFFEPIGARYSLWTNVSLSTQLKWFEELKPTLCNTQRECDDYFKKALFLVGEIGGNDYNYAFFAGRDFEEVRVFAPQVVGAITAATERLINQGAVNLVVPGNLPVGCSTAYLTVFASKTKSEYDADGCLDQHNRFAKYHNALLQSSLEKLRGKYPQAKIVYADYYHAALPFVHAPKHYGFMHGALKTCCGGGGPYNFNPAAPCGREGATVCSNPLTYANWDGIHLTEAAYRSIATNLVHGPYTTPPLLVIK